MHKNYQLTSAFYKKGHDYDSCVEGEFYTIEETLEALEKELGNCEAYFRDLPSGRRDYTAEYLIIKWVDDENDPGFNFWDVYGIEVKYDDFEAWDWIDKKMAQIKKELKNS